MPDGGYGEDAKRHGQREQPPGGGPGAQADAPVELQPRAGERHDDDELRQPLGELRVGERVRRLARREGEGCAAGGNAGHGQGERQLAEHQRQPGDEQDERAGAGKQKSVGVHPAATRHGRGG